MDEEEQSDEGMLQPPWLLNANEVYPRVVGVITTLSSLYMLFMAWKKHESLFQRLVFGMSFHLLLFGVFLMYGTNAIPSVDSYESGKGTIATCTTQGFFIVVCRMSATLYYAGFSVYGYAGVLNNFNTAKIVWVEKYIHLLAHIYPLSIGIYFLVMQGYNNCGFGYCAVSSRPFGCQSASNDIECERGHQDYKVMKGIYGFWLAFVVLFPTVVMVTLYIKVKQRQAQVNIRAKVVLLQSFVYLVVIYLTIVPWFVVLFIPIKRMKEIGKANLVAMVIFSLFGLWSVLVYYYFTTNMSIISYKSKDASNATTSLSLSLTLTNHSKGNTDVTLPTSNDIDDEHTPSQPRYSFNIFDGTNAGGAFADFIHDADSDDDDVNEGNEKWAAIQDHL